jgi:hypothetical protein
MNALLGIAILTGIIYGLLVDGTFFKIYFALLLIYHVLTQVIFVNKKDITKRKKITITTWESPADPHSYIPVDLDCTKTLPYV